VHPLFFKSWYESLVIALGGHNRQLNNPVPLLVCPLYWFLLVCYVIPNGEEIASTSCLGGEYVEVSVEFQEGE